MLLRTRKGRTLAIVTALVFGALGASAAGWWQGLWSASPDEPFVSEDPRPPIVANDSENRLAREPVVDTDSRAPLMEPGQPVASDTDGHAPHGTTLPHDPGLMPDGRYAYGTSSGHYIVIEADQPLPPEVIEDVTSLAKREFTDAGDNPLARSGSLETARDKLIKEAGRTPAFVYPAEGPASPDSKVTSKGWMYVTYGDAIAFSGLMSREEALAEAQAWIDENGGAAANVLIVLD